MSVLTLLGLLIGVVLIPLIVIAGQIRRRRLVMTRPAGQNITSWRQVPLWLWGVLGLFLLPGISAILLVISLALTNGSHVGH